MAAALSFYSITGGLKTRDRRATFRPSHRYKPAGVRCRGENPAREPSSRKVSEPGNPLLKIAWYSSELLGVAASVLRRPPNRGTKAPETDCEIAIDGSGQVGRADVVTAIKQDFKRSYFVTGNLTPGVYEENCEFADPAGSFNGLRRFKRNCTNFGSLIQRSNMKLMRWEDFEDKGVGHWRFNCVMSFPWKPILSATGYTEYYFDAESGKVCRHVEHWNVPKIALFKQLLKPCPGAWGRKARV